MEMDLNAAAWRITRRLLDAPQQWGVTAHQAACGATVIDCGVKAAGGWRAGLELARVCLSGLAEVALAPAPAASAWPGPHVAVTVNDPVWACLGSQYAGWKITSEADPKFFAMGSGPMRLAYGKEELLGQLQLRQRPGNAVGVLETSSLPDDEVCRSLAERCGVSPRHLTLLAARTGSLAGGVQIAARTVETALHKMHELQWDVRTVKAGWGTAPAPPSGPDNLQAIGWTNDAVLYGGDVWLWLDCDEERLRDIGPRIPSQSSSDHGRPFGELFAACKYDFYKVDPLLFSPARVTLGCLATGRCFSFGEFRPDVLAKSFGGETH